MLSALKNANLGLAFLLELTALGAFAYWGFFTGEGTLVKIVLGIGAPVLGALLWGIFAAPQSSRRLHGPAYLIFAVVFFALAVVALIAADSPLLGVIVGVVFVINRILLIVWQQEIPSAG